MLVRPALPADLGAVTALIDRAVRISNAPEYNGAQQLRVLADYTFPAMKRRLADSDLFLVAELQVWASPERVVSGVLVANRARRASAEDVAVIDALFVDPNAQGMGVGAALLDELYDRARKRGIERLTVAASLTAVGFYAHVGFSRVARGLSHAGVDTVMMERMIR
ncbi:MAG: GNAT family N-acetyltransferase [Hyphomicrobiales bacterium]|nr:GNAT family N-acetyltransferase [Hyphomicrobiales bacterium]